MSTWSSRAKGRRFRTYRQAIAQLALGVSLLLAAEGCTSSGVPEADNSMAEPAPITTSAPSSESVRSSATPPPSLQATAAATSTAVGPTSTLAPVRGTGSPVELPLSDVSAPTGLAVLSERLVVADLDGSIIREIEVLGPADRAGQILHTFGPSVYVSGLRGIQIIDDVATSESVAVDVGGNVGPVVEAGYFAWFSFDDDFLAEWSFFAPGDEPRVVATAPASSYPMTAIGTALVMWNREASGVILVDGTTNTVLTTGGALLARERVLIAREGSVVVLIDASTGTRLVVGEMGDRVSAATFGAADLSPSGGHIALRTKDRRTYDDHTLTVIDLTSGSSTTWPVAEAASVTWIDDDRLVLGWGGPPRLFDVRTGDATVLDLPEGQISVLRER